MMNQKKRLRLWLYVVLPLIPLTAVMLFGQGYPAQAIRARARARLRR
jgi:hypothetical protein